MLISRWRELQSTISPKLPLTNYNFKVRPCCPKNTETVSTHTSLYPNTNIYMI